jgi:hypothetical protein
LHPTLEIRFEGYFDKRGRKFAFSLVEYPGLLVETTSWATWDCLGQLLVARDGCIERWQLGDFAKGAPGLRVDLEDLQPPAVDSSKRSGEGGGARP